ncbi:MAG: hypothetical protein ACYDAN_14200 [Candidatus Limnocylindrales bacterium]
MTGQRTSASPITRRRFLGAAGALAVGAAGVLELLRRGLPAATPGPATPVGVAVVSQPRQAFHSRPDLTPPLIEAATPAGAVGAGPIFLTPANGAGTDGPTIVDGRGELVWMRPGTGRMAADLRVSAPRGKPALTWWEGSTNGGVGSGEHVVTDGSYRELARIRAANGRQADLHELQLTPAGGALFFADAAVAARLPAGVAPAPWPVMGRALQEVDVATAPGRIIDPGWSWPSA